MPTVRWLIDGMNVIGCRPDGWWRDRDGAMTRLVRALERFVASEQAPVAVIFERPPSATSSAIEIGHAPRPGPNAADHEIVRRLRCDPEPSSVCVVTSDRALAKRVCHAGANVTGASAFRARLDRLD